MSGGELATVSTVLAIYLLVVVSPGPNFVVVTRTAVASGGGAAFFVTIGIASGATINASIALFGAGAAIVHSPAFGVGVAAVGGAVLIGLGLQAVRAAVVRPQRPPADGERAGAPAFGAAAAAGAAGSPLQTKYAGAFTKGLFVNLFNPKAIAFFLGLYAPLMATAAPVLKLAVLTVCFGIELAWYGTVILFFTRPRVRALYARSASLFDALMGAILLFLGLRILLEIPNHLERMHG